MKRKIFLPAIALFFFTACNNSTENKETTGDTTRATMDHSDMGTTSSTVPALPAVPAGAKVFFSNLKENEVISSPFKLSMGAEGIKVDTAGPVVAGIAHHHLFIDAEDSLPAGTVVPADSSHIHFGKGQTEYELKLSPGKHKLTLQMADGLHRSYGSALATTINVEVKK